MGVVSIIDGCIDNRVNERDWQRGVVGRAYLYTIYISCYVKVGKLGFCEHGFSNCACFKNLYLYER